MPSWDDFRYLLAVQRHGSLARAGKALGLNKSTVSRRITTLEEELGVALLERGPLGYELSDAGRRTAAAAERIEVLVNQLCSDVGGTDRVAAGTVSVTAPHWFAQRLIIPELPELREKHPNLHVDLLTTDVVVDLTKREADIAIRNQRPTQHSLIVRKAGVIDFALYASPEYLSRHGTPKSRSDFDGHQLIAYQNAVAYVKEFRWTNELECPIALRASDAESMLDAITAGLGIGVLPCFITTGRPGIVCLTEVGPPAPEDIWLVTHEDSRAIARVRVVTEWLSSLFVKHAAWLAGTDPGR